MSALLRNRIAKIERHSAAHVTPAGPVVALPGNFVLIPANDNAPSFNIRVLPRGAFLDPAGNLVSENACWRGLKLTPPPDAELLPTAPIQDAGEHTVTIGAAFVSLFERGHYRYKIYKGGRGGAKSTAFAIASILLARSQPLTIVCGRQFQVSIAQSVKKLLDDWITKLGFAAEFNSTHTEITHLRTGSTFTFIGLDRNPDSIRSLEGADICWIEEAATITQESLDILIPTIRKAGSEIWFSYNPRYDDDAVDARFQDPRDNVLVKEVDYRDNPFFFLSPLPEEMSSLSHAAPKRYAHVWRGAYSVLADAAIFTNIEVKDLGWAIPESWPLLGLDFSRGGSDPHAIVRLFVNRAERFIYISHEHVGHSTIDDLPAFVKSVPNTDDQHIRADSANPDLIEMLNGRDLAVIPAKKGPGSVIAGILWLQGYKLIVHPRCVITLRELQRYAWETDKRTGKILHKPVDADNHTIDAIRYACEDYMETDEDHGGVTVVRFPARKPK